jgi:hypothetical protein
MGEPTPVQLFEAGAQVQLTALAAVKAERESRVATLNAKIAELEAAKVELAGNADVVASIQSTIDATLNERNIIQYFVAQAQTKIDNINSVLEDGNDADKSLFYTIITTYQVPYERWGFEIKPKLIQMIRAVYENANLPNETKRTIIQAEIDRYSPTSPAYD